MPRILGFFVAAWTVGMALPAQAQQAVLSQLYGQGVHEFYGGDYQAARQSLTEAAANDSRDPRVYYYRALANLRLGDESAAKSDFDTAAALEFTPAGRQFAVSRSLQRVQGRERQTLEKHRAQAKITAYRAAEQRRQARYGREQQADFDELREQAVSPATAIDRGLPPGTESVDVPKRPATVIDPATAADSAADEQAPASGIGGIVGRALGNGDAPPTPPVVAPTTPPAAAVPPSTVVPTESGLFGDEDEAAVEPAVAEPDALEATEDPVPTDNILAPEPEAVPAATEAPASEPTAPAPADEGDPFADSDDTKAPADEAPLAEEAPFEEEPALEEPAETAPAATEVDDLEAPAAEMPVTEAPAAAEDSLDDAMPADAPPADPALEAEAPLDDPAAPVADPLGEEPPGEEPADALEDPAAAPADAAPSADPLAEEPAADPLFDEPAAEAPAGDPAADAPLEDPAADSADPALEEPAGESLEEMPAEPAAEESLEEAPAEEAPADEAPLPE